MYLHTLCGIRAAGLAARAAPRPFKPRPLQATPRRAAPRRSAGAALPSSGGGGGGRGAGPGRAREEAAVQPGSVGLAQDPAAGRVSPPVWGLEATGLPCLGPPGAGAAPHYLHGGPGPGWRPVGAAGRHGFTQALLPLSRVGLELTCPPHRHPLALLLSPHGAMVGSASAAVTPIRRPPRCPTLAGGMGWIRIRNLVAPSLCSPVVYIRGWIDKMDNIFPLARTAA